MNSKKIKEEGVIKKGRRLNQASTGEVEARGNKKLLQKRGLSKKRDKKRRN